METTVKVSANFLTIPLITSYNFNENFSLSLGPQIGFLLNTVTKFDGDRDKSPGDFRFDFGPTLGAGFKPTDNLRLQLRYYLGISNVFRDSARNAQGDKRITYDSVFQLSMGYAIF